MVLRRERGLPVQVHLGNKELCVFCLMLKLGARTEISKKQSSGSPGRCALLGWERWNSAGEWAKPGPPFISTDSGSRPSLSLTSGIHAFIYRLKFILHGGDWHFSHCPAHYLLFYWLGWLASVLTFVNFSLVHSTGLSHSWAGWQLLPSLCSPSSCISFHWDILSLSGVSKALLNCLYHLKNLVLNVWLTLTVCFGIYGHDGNRQVS